MIKIDNNYRLESDSNQWTLIYEKEGEINPKTNKSIMSTDKWYCASLGSALDRYVNEASKVSKTAEELLRRLAKIQYEINGLRSILKK